MEDLVVIKSNGGVIELWMESTAGYGELKEALLSRLNMHKSFYSGTSQKVMFYGKQLTDEQKREMKNTLFNCFDIKNVGFVDEEIAVPPAARLGADVGYRPIRQYDAAENIEQTETAGEAHPFAKPLVRPSRSRPKTEDKAEEAPEPQPGNVFLPQTVRGGQSIRSKGDIIVIGDVNAGAELIADGSIVVFGKLRGVAHAGASGRLDVMIATNGLRASQIRICGKIAIIPPEHPGNVPEVAELIDDKIVVHEIG